MTQFEITNQILALSARDTALSSTEKGVLVCISFFFDKSMKCYPSINKIVDISGFSGSTVKRSVAALEKRNILKKTRRFSATGPTSNLYQLNPKELFKTDKTNSVKKTDINKDLYLGGDGNYYSCPAEYFLAIAKH